MKSSALVKYEKQNIHRTALEKFGLEPVPQELKNTRWFEYAIMQFSYSPNAGNFLVPALAVTVGGLSFGWAFLSALFGASLSFIVFSIMSLPGSKYGIPSQYAFRSFLGINGARYISSPIRAIVLIYWFAVQTISGALFIQVMLQKLGGMTIPLLPISLIMAILMSILSIVGYEAVRKITKYCLPVLIAGGIFALILFLTSQKESFYFAQVWNSPEATNKPLSMFFFASLAFVQFLSGSWSSSDLTRYAKTDRDAHWGLLIGNFFGYSFTAFLAIYSVSATGEWNAYITANELTNSHLVGAVIFLAAMISMLLINMNNAYSGGYSLLNCFPSLGRLKSTILFCLLGILLCFFPIFVSEAQRYISFLGYLAAPVVGVIFMEFVFMQKRTINLAVLDGSYRYNRRAITVIILGTILAFVLPEAWPVGLLTFGIVVLVYPFLSKFEEWKVRSYKNM